MVGLPCGACAKRHVARRMPHGAHPMTDRRIETRARHPRAADCRGELFGEHGYDGTSIEAILERSGVARGALYHHFADKEALFDAVLEATVAEVAATNAEPRRARHPNRRGPARRLRALAEGGARPRRPADRAHRPAGGGGLVAVARARRAEDARRPARDPTPAGRRRAPARGRRRRPRAHDPRRGERGLDAGRPRRPPAARPQGGSVRSGHADRPARRTAARAQHRRSTAAR